jgi:hypothetical protein
VEGQSKQAVVIACSTSAATSNQKKKSNYFRAVYGAVACAGCRRQKVHTAAHTRSNAAATVQLVSKLHEKLIGKSVAETKHCGRGSGSVVAPAAFWGAMQTP